jgi:integrase
MGKRANGEGTVYRRDDGRWVASISLENGKRKSIYCKTQREAIKEVQRANLAKEQGMLSTLSDETLGAFLTSWLQDTAKPNLRPRTYIRYRELMELHVLCRAKNPEEPEEHPPDGPGARVAEAPPGAAERIPTLRWTALG